MTHDAAYDAIIYSDYPNLTRRELDLMLPVIQAAITTERERAVQIVERWKGCVHEGDHLEDVLEHVIKKIRSGQP